MSRAARHRSGEIPAEVLVAAQANAPWAFERIYEFLAPRVTGYLRLRGAADPEGLANEVMLGVFQGLPSFEGDVEAFRSWVFTIAYRRVVDDRRRRSARPDTSELTEGHGAAPGGDVEHEALAQLEDERLRALIEELRPDQRDVLLLRLVADLSVEETAEAMGKRPGAVKMLQRRALAAIRRRLSVESVT